ncbi:MAG TPA: hypothetical protein VEH04_18410 [Verrucomicrobiae bacterium]|nr:hypothetical protein [Verrucomicrobiae bacterium]
MMKKLVLLFSCLTLLLTGCATTQVASEEPTFREGRQADVILRFSSWEYTFMTKPFYAEDGFMQQVKPASLKQVLNRFDIDRDMAVVVVGVQYNGADLDNIVAEWKKVLGESCGFERVVVLRASRNSELNGSIIVADTRFPITTAQAE